jgi:hypothetical protein
MSQNDTPQISLEMLALEALRSVCLSTDAPAAAKAAAARTLLEACGKIGRNQEIISDEKSKDLSTLSVQELDKLISKFEGKA